MYSLCVFVHVCILTYSNINECIEYIIRIKEIQMYLDKVNNIHTCMLALYTPITYICTESRGVNRHQLLCYLLHVCIHTITWAIKLETGTRS